jgi:hypothetical protein
MNRERHPAIDWRAARPPAVRPSPTAPAGLAGTAVKSTAEASSAAAVTIEILSATATPQSLARIIEVRVAQARRARPTESIPETAIFGAPAVSGIRPRAVVDGSARSS